MVNQAPAPNPFLLNQKPAGSQAVDNENANFVCCQECCGNCLNFGCFPCCLVCGCNRVTIHQGNAGIMMRNGRFYKSLPPGIYLINSCLYTVTTISVKSRVVVQRGTQLLTTDNMSVNLHYFVNFEILDPYSASRGLAQVDMAVLTIAGGKLKAIVSSLKFQDLLRGSMSINKALREALHAELEGVGIHVNACEVTNIILSAELTMSMAQVAISERDRLAQIKLADANFEASKYTNEAASILKDNQSSMDLQFFETLKSISQNWNETIIAADGMLYLPNKAKGK